MQTHRRMVFTDRIDAAVNVKPLYATEATRGGGGDGVGTVLVHVALFDRHD